MRVSLPLLKLCACIVLTASGSAQVRVTILAELEGETSSPSLSPDGKTLAFVWCRPDYSCSIFTRPIQGGEPKLLVGQDSKDGSPWHPKWSPDGHTLAFTRSYSRIVNHLFVLPLSGGPERDFGRICWGGPFGWSPDSKFLVAGVYRDETDFVDCRLILISAQTGDSVREFDSRGTAPAFSPDGRSLAFADDKVLRLVRLTPEYGKRGPVLTIATEPRQIVALAWTRDSRQLLYRVWGDSPYLRKLRIGVAAKPQLIADLTSQLAIAEFLPDGSALATESAEEANLWQVDLEAKNPRVEKAALAPGSALSPDGRRCAFISTRTGVSQIWVANADRTNPRLLVGSIPDLDVHNPAVPSNLRWSPDGRWIAFTAYAFRGNADNRSWLYVVPASGGPLRRLGEEAASIFGPSWAPDGRSIYASQSNGTVYTYSRDELVRIDLVDGKITQITQGGGIWPRPSADGKFLYYFSTPRTLLSRVSASGGIEERLTDHTEYYLATVGTKYLYVFKDLRNKSKGLANQLVRFDPETREAVPLVTVPFRPTSAFLLRDRYLYFEQVDDLKRRVVLVRGL